MRRPVPLPFDNAQGEWLGSLYPFMVSLLWKDEP